MKRKLIKQGTGEGLVMYLPREWIKEKGLTQGNEVTIEQINDTLLITSESKKNNNEFKIDISIDTENYKTVRMLLKNYYNLGFKEITIKYKNEKVYSLIKEIYEKVLFGFEISSHDKEEKAITLSEFSTIDEKNSKKLINKLFFMFGDSLTELEKYMQTGKKNSLERIKINTDKIDKFESIIRRQIFTKKNDDQHQNVNYWNFISYIVIGQRAINRLLEHQYDDISKSISEIEKINQIFELFHKKIFLREKIDDINEYTTKILELQDNLKSKINNNPNINHYLLEISNDIYFMVAPVISMITIDKNKLW